MLELAAGPGETGFLAAQRLGPEGRLISTDQSPEMVEVARRRAAEWAAPDQNMWMAAPAMALIARGALPPPDPSNPSPFAMPQPDGLAGRLEGAGFGDVRAETIAFTQSYPSLDAYWDITIDVAAPVAQALATLDAAGGAAVREQVVATLAPFIGPDGSLQASATAVVASGVA